MTARTIAVRRMELRDEDETPRIAFWDLFEANAPLDLTPEPAAVSFGPGTLENGVASGDVTEDSVVLWARSTALGTMTFSVFAVDDDGRRTLVERIEAEVTNTDVPVKILVDDLNAGTEYIYRVRDAAGDREAGTFKTAHESGFNGLTFGVTGDWRGDLAPFHAVSNVDERDLDLFVFHGDTIYADYDSPAQDATIELDGYRVKYQENYGERDGENFFADLRKSVAIYATIDDHEVINDFAGGADAASDARLPETEGLVNDTQAYEDGLQAFQEYHPIADEFYGDTGDERTAGERQLYRAQEFGQDAAMFILDQRSFRDSQIDAIADFDITNEEEVARFLEESFDPTRTMLGDAQLADLKADLLAAEANGVTWKFVYTPEPMQDLGLFAQDSWDGYRAERNEILQFIDENDIDNVVFVAADIHATFVNNLTYQTEIGGEQIATSAFEITTGSVAFDPVFGAAALDIAGQLGLLPEALVALVDAIPSLALKDAIVEQAFNLLTLAPRGYDPLGLDDNLAQADGLIDAELLEGGWVAANSYGWSEFDIDAETQALTITTWGIPAYAPDEVGTLRYRDTQPEIVSQFVVNPEIDGLI